MEDYKDVQLFSKIYVGSEKQAFDVIFDTGSAVRLFYSQDSLNSGHGFKDMTAIPALLTIDSTPRHLRPTESSLAGLSTSR
jgi:hypothetical protein